MAFLEAGACCFCGLALTDARSTAVGYGRHLCKTLGHVVIALGAACGIALIGGCRNLVKNFRFILFLIGLVLLMGSLQGLLQ